VSTRLSKWKEPAETAFLEHGSEGPMEKGGERCRTELLSVLPFFIGFLGLRETHENFHRL
jgi:hypothetical protein